MVCRGFLVRPWDRGGRGGGWGVWGGIRPSLVLTLRWLAALCDRWSNLPYLFFLPCRPLLSIFWVKFLPQSLSFYEVHRVAICERMMGRVCCWYFLGCGKYYKVGLSILLLCLPVCENPSFAFSLSSSIPEWTRIVVTPACCSMGESILLLSRKLGEVKGGMMRTCIMHFYNCASVCCFCSIVQVALICKRACVCLVFLDFLYPLFSD